MIIRVVARATSERRSRSSIPSTRISRKRPVATRIRSSNQSSNSTSRYSRTSRRCAFRSKPLLSHLCLPSSLFLLRPSACPHPHLSDPVLGASPSSLRSSSGSPTSARHATLPSKSTTSSSSSSASTTRSSRTTSSSARRMRTSRRRRPRPKRRQWAQQRAGESCARNGPGILQRPGA